MFVIFVAHSFRTFRVRDQTIDEHRDGQNDNFLLSHRDTRTRVCREKTHRCKTDDFLVPLGTQNDCDVGRDLVPDGEHTYLYV